MESRVPQIRCIRLPGQLPDAPWPMGKTASDSHVPPGVIVSGAFGNLLRRLRIAASLSQEALAEKARMSAAAIGAYERGLRSAPHRESVELLAEALELTGDTRREFEGAARRKSRTRTTEKLAPADAAGSLPSEVTAFFGRASEIAAITELLGQHQLVTITGTGGVGKTRVALQVAMHQQRRDGVWFVDLGSVLDPSRVVPKIMSVVPLPSLGGEQTPEALAQFLCDRSVLLIFDNCEHVIDVAGSVVSALARVAPEVQVLATSRHRLQIASEAVFRLLPLPYPDVSDVSAQEALKFPAVQLFAARSNAAYHHFILSNDNVAAAVDICRQVDGIPLAVELAAARLSTFGIAALRDRLRDRLGPFMSNVRDAPGRQQTLRATIDWSYTLLDDQERALLQRLAIFSGGCMLVSAEEVCAYGSLDREWIQDGLAALVDSSLISVDITLRTPRYTIFESTRQYALEKLPEEDHGRLAGRHAAWCAGFADELKHATHELTYNEWALMVLPEFDNIYQAIAWATKRDRLAYARIVGSLYFLWWRIGRLEEGRRFAVDALSELDEEAHPLVAAQLHVARSISLSSASKIEAAQHAIDLYEQFGEPRGLVEAYLHLGGGYLMSRDRERLREVVAHVTELVGRSGERYFAPLISWLRAGVYSLDGDTDAARQELLNALREPKVTEQEAGYEIGHALTALEHSVGNTERAAELADELVAAASKRRMINHEMYALLRSSGYHLLLGNTERAAKAAHDALLASRGLNSTTLTTAIQLLATVAVMRGETVRAARLHGYVTAWFAREEYNHVNLPAECTAMLTDALRVQLTADALQQHMAAGTLLSESAAIAEAVQIAAQTAGPS
jgi:predicted ATPase/DNA-binding XRE family transcriptional regulator